jgi:ABC-2 type transport system permease protein
LAVTMLQHVVFLFSTYGSTQGDKPVAIVAAVIPFCSPFMMLARAATDDALWPHLAALVWQVLWVAIFVRTGARLFRTRVMKSGGAGAKRGLFGRRKAALT